MIEASTSESIRPSEGSERLELIDALRGFALAGVLLVNLGAMSLYFFVDDAARAAMPTAAFDTVARLLKGFFVDRKAMTLFSMLFGLGFAIQLERARSRGVTGLRTYIRRILILLVFGLLHVYLVWWGDVLLMYALMALLLVPLRDVSSRSLLWGGLVVALVLPPLLAPWIAPLLAGLPAENVIYAKSLHVFSTQGYASVVRQNFAFGNWTYLAWWDEWFFIFGRFLLGFWAGRTLLLHQAAANRALLRRIFVVASIVGVGATALAYAEESLKAAVPAFAQSLGLFALSVVLRAGPLGLGIAYACAFALLFLREGWRQKLLVLAPVGRMALTNYLTQSMLGVAIFYGMGLGVGPRYGYISWLLVWGLIFGAQIVFSRWWLERHRFGPMEWLWRSLTYGQRQRLRIVPAPTG